MNTAGCTGNVDPFDARCGNRIYAGAREGE
jgi:hypothetical protein